MFKSKKKVEFNDEELRTILHALNDFRTDLLKEDKLVDPNYKRKALLKENQDTPEIDELLLKIIDISETM